MRYFLLTWIATAVSLLITAHVVPGFHVKSFVAAAIAAVILGLINATIRPILVVLTLPLTVLTLGLFIFVINAVILLLVSSLTPGFGFTIAGFGPALLGSIVLTVVASVLSLLVRVV